MSVNIVSTSNQLNSPESSDGYQVGKSSASLVGFYGATPVARPTGYASVTDSSGGTAAATNGIQTITATYNSAILANAIATLAAEVNGIQSALVTLGIIAG